MSKQKLFLKVFSVSQVQFYNDLTESEQYYWNDKSTRLGYDNFKSSYQNKSGIYAEFSKVGAIGLAVLKEEEVHFKFLCNESEKELLSEFFTLINNKFSANKYQLVGYNIKEFDVPFLSRRLIVNGVTLPELLKVKNDKPWDYPHLELMNLWKFGDYKSFVPLGLLCSQFDIDYKRVKTIEELREAYFEGRIGDIEEYLKNDVNSMIGLFKRIY